MSELPPPPQEIIVDLNETEELRTESATAQGGEDIFNKEEMRVEIDMKESDLGFNGSIKINGFVQGHFTLEQMSRDSVSSPRFFLRDIQIGYDEDSLRNKGFGYIVYRKIIDFLRDKGALLRSTDYSFSCSAISPQALRVWKKLEGAGVARVVGEGTGRVHDRFAGETQVAVLPIYESV